MKWSRKSILAEADGWAKAVESTETLKKNATVEEFVTYMKSLSNQGLVVKSLETEAEQRNAFKAVVISFGPGDDVTINEDEELDTAALDEGDEDDDEAISSSKAYKLLIKKFNLNTGNTPHMAEVMHAGKARSAESTERSWARKSYNHKAANNQTVFADADMAEFYLACTRLNSMGQRGYSQKRVDIELVTKTGATYDNSLGGVLIPDHFSTEMIELIPSYGTAREYAGVYPMAGLREFVPRFGDDAVTYNLAEGVEATESKPTFDGIWLNAEEIGTLSLLPLRLLDNAAINVADVVARSHARSRAKFEDNSFWNSANNFAGVSSKIGASSTHTVSGASAYTNVTVLDAQTFISKIPDWVDNHTEDLAIYCHRSIDDQVFQRFGPGAGGASTIDMVSGRITEFKGIPIKHVNVMNNGRTFTSGNVVAYVGALKAATKFGEVTGANKVMESDQRYMEKRQWAVLSSTELAINCHNVLNGAESGLWALKVTS